jgi:hypothetical protein
MEKLAVMGPKEWVLGLSVLLVVAEAVAGSLSGPDEAGVAGAVEAAVALGLVAALLLWKYREPHVIWVWWLGLVGAVGLLALGAWRASPVPPSSSSSGAARLAGGCAVVLALVLGGLLVFKYRPYIRLLNPEGKPRVAKFWAGSAAALGLAGLGLWWVSAPPPGAFAGRNSLQGVGAVSVLLVGLLGGVIAFGLSQTRAVQRMSASQIRPQPLRQPSIQGGQRQSSIQGGQRQPSTQVIQRQPSAQYVPPPGLVADKDDVTVYS